MLHPERRPINDLIHEFDVLASRMLDETVNVVFTLDPEAGACEIDPAQFGSALLNLVVNARDAMSAGGTLTIRSSNLALDARLANRHADAQPGKYVVVEVLDTGIGMTTELMERVTEPFFTTKEVGRGTGLGLSQVYGFVRQSGGFLTIDSVVGKGTSIRIHLPQVLATAIEAENVVEVRTGSGVVLIVEDDADVRDLVAVQLEELGYSSIVAASGPEALKILAKPELPAIDLLLTDVVMPGGMNGIALVREARQMQPGLRALLTSGYMVGNAPGAPGAPEAELADLRLLSKPYQQDDLARAIQEVLECH